MPTASTTATEDLDLPEEFIKFEEPKKINKQKFHRAIKRDYNRHNFYQKTR